MAPEEIKRVFEAGASIAKAYKAGETFLGAWGEAEKLGYAPDSWQRTIFTVGYCSNLKKPIVTTRDGVITQYGTD
jgi:hypothetical protein